MAEFVVGTNKVVPDEEEELVFDNVEPIELRYDRISVVAKIKVEEEINGEMREVDGEKSILK